MDKIKAFLYMVLAFLTISIIYFLVENVYRDSLPKTEVLEVDMISLLKERGVECTDINHNDTYSDISGKIKDVNFELTCKHYGDKKVYITDLRFGLNPGDAISSTNGDVDGTVGLNRDDLIITKKHGLDTYLFDRNLEIGLLDYQLGQIIYLANGGEIYGAAIKSRQKEHSSRWLYRFAPIDNLEDSILISKGSMPDLKSIHLCKVDDLEIDPSSLISYSDFKEQYSKDHQ